MEHMAYIFNVPSAGANIRRTKRLPRAPGQKGRQK